MNTQAHPLFQELATDMARIFGGEKVVDFRAERAKREREASERKFKARPAGDFTPPEAA